MGVPPTGRSMADRRRTKAVLVPSPVAALTDTSADLSVFSSRRSTPIR
jgi:hypothetical protein